MEKGNAAKFKNKTLEEIDVDMNEIDSIVEEDDEVENFHRAISLSTYN